MLRAAPDRGSRRCDAAWSALEAWLGARLRHDEEDIHQEVLVAVFRRVGMMEAQGPGQALVWLSAILKNKRIDALRRKQLQRERHSDLHEGVPGERVAAPEGDPPRSARDAEETLARVEAAVRDHVDASEKTPSSRAGRRLRAQACLDRLVRGLEADAILERLALDEPISRGLLDKWVERGRAPIEAAMTAWAASAPDDEDVQRVASHVLERVRARRADQGRPRPARRKH